MTDTLRNAELKQILTERRRAIEDEVQSRIRGGRDGRKEGGDELERSDADVQGDLEFALLQMRAETLARIDEALLRLGAGQYGSCFECAEEISDRRLRAMPFAVRCQTCEETREQGQRSAQQLAQRRGSLSLFAPVVGS